MRAPVHLASCAAQAVVVPHAAVVVRVCAQPGRLQVAIDLVADCGNPAAVIAGDLNATPHTSFQLPSRHRLRADEELAMLTGQGNRGWRRAVKPPAYASKRSSVVVEHVEEHELLA